MHTGSKRRMCCIGRATNTQILPSGCSVGGWQRGMERDEAREVCRDQIRKGGLVVFGSGALGLCPEREL